jgi:hypothetical protein
MNIIKLCSSAVLLSVTLLLSAQKVQAQFAPQAPLPGHEGIAVNDTRIVDWAHTCTVTRGWLDIANKSLGQVSMGTDTNAIGMANAAIVSLGDSGVAVLGFEHSIKNGPGPDFAVFENGFSHLINDTLAYLEFAFVEVSSDGIQFFRFPATCEQQDSVQTEYTFVDARLFHNLAGKYKSGFGTPFDLEELKDLEGLDVDHITHVRIVDVVGSINRELGSMDAMGNMVNDPYPTPFPGGGFDLNAVAVLNSNKPVSVNTNAAGEIQLQVFPNPATRELNIQVPLANATTFFQILDLSGRILKQGKFTGATRVDLQQFAAGLYILRCTLGQETAVFKIKKS